jgi:peptidoglycan/LPS O-acetylase OafA/YrhL
LVAQMTIARWTRGRDNSFDLLRLIAAGLVLLSHSFALAASGEPQIGSHSVGFFGVEVFFAISGFLVVQSWALDARVSAFAIKRGLRILPALAVVVLLSAFVLGPLLTTRSLGDYLTSTETLRYPVQNLVSVATGGLVGGPAYELPGVFASNPHDASVNGSLWTLPVEVDAYAMLVLLGLTGLLRRALPVLAIAAVAATSAPSVLEGMPVLGSRVDAVALLGVFAIGSLLYLHRDRVPLRFDVAAVLLIAAIAALGTPLERLTSTLAIPYLVLVAAYRTSPRARSLTRRGDVSYGLYLLAFPVQQTLLAVWGGPHPAPLVLFAVSLPLTYALAYLSWRLVEAQALKAKKHLLTPRPRSVPAPVAEPVPAPVTSSNRRVR